MRLGRWLPLGVVFAAAALGISRPANAQTATLTGNVTDPSGAAVPGAGVTARNTEVGTTRATQTGSTGSFALPNLSPGRYDVTIEKTGFARMEFRDVTLTVDQALTLNAQMQVSPVNQTVIVNAADLPAVDLQSSSISNIVTAAQISQLPLLLRDPYTLILLSPGVIQSNAPIGGSPFGGYSANGARERDNNILLDGVDNNNANVPGYPSGRGLTSINPDTAEEFRVITNNFSADIGRNDGAIVDIMTRRGTNMVHGDAYWFGRYSALGARDFFASSKNPYTRNDFGASVGGPIRRDTLFFFTNYEGQRFLTTVTKSGIVPTDQFKSGNFTYNSTSVSVTPDPVIQNLLRTLYPTPNGKPVDDIRGYLNYPSPSRDFSDNVTGRVDFNLSSQNTLALRYVLNQGSDTDPFHDESLPGGLGAISTVQRAQNLSLKLTSVVSPTLVNELRGGANRSSQQFNCGGLSAIDQFSAPDQFGRGSDLYFFDVSSFGCFAPGDSNGQVHHIGTYTFGDSLTWVTGPHTVKLGGEYRGVYFNGYNDFSSRPLVYLVACGCNVLQDMEAMLEGHVYEQTQTQFFNSAGNPTADDLRGYRQHELGLYLQDSWKLRSNFTVNYGLRWEYFGVPYEVHDNLSNLYVPANGVAPFTFQIVGPGGRSLYQPDYHDFAPRVGFAWDPFKTGRTSIRGGFGIFYDRAYDDLFGNLAGNPPFEEHASTFPSTPYAQLQPPAPATTAPGAVVTQGALITPTLIDPNLKNPSALNWSLGVQREITHSLTFEADYVGRKGTHLFNVIDGNQPDPALVAQLLAYCSVPNMYSCTPAELQAPGILWYGGDYHYLPFDAVHNTAFESPSLIESAANSSYNGLQTKATLRAWHGLQAQLSYTYSHAIDNASDPSTPTVNDQTFPVNSLNLAAERGNSGFDIRHVAVLNFSYRLPVGRGSDHWNRGMLGRALEAWQLGGIATFQGGLPFDIFGNVDSQYTGFDDRATIVANPRQPASADKTFTGPALSAFEETPPCSAVELAANDCHGSNLSRNRFYGPGLNNWDVIFMKDSSLTERISLQLRFEFYNLFNRTDFAQPYNNISNAGGIFGESSTTLIRPDGTSSARQIQIGAKIIF